MIRVTAVPMAEAMGAEATGEEGMAVAETESAGRVEPRATAALRRSADRVVNRLRSMPPALWFGLVMALLLAAFAAALLFQPTVGRGGR